MSFSDGQLAILVGMLIQTVIFAFMFGGFKGRTEARLDDHDERLNRIDPPRHFSAHH